MRDLPDGVDLLDTARSLLRNELISLLPLERRGDALMIANAMAIAGRQLATGVASDWQQLHDLQQLLQMPAAVAPQALPATLLALNQRLCGAIREGNADPGTPLHDDARAFLLASARSKVAVSNPKYLHSPTGKIS